MSIRQNSDSQEVEMKMDEDLTASVGIDNQIGNETIGEKIVSDTVGHSTLSLNQAETMNFSVECQTQRTTFGQPPTPLTSFTEELNPQGNQERNSPQKLPERTLETDWESLSFSKADIDLTFDEDLFNNKDLQEDKHKLSKQQESLNEEPKGDCTGDLKLSEHKHQQKSPFSKKKILEKTKDETQSKDGSYMDPNLIGDSAETIQSRRKFESNSIPHLHSDKKDEQDLQLQKISSDLVPIQTTSDLLEDRSTPNPFAKTCNETAENKLAQECIDIDNISACGIIYESYVDISLASEMPKIRFNSSIAEDVLKSLKDTKVQTAGFYGDFDTCVESAGNYLGKDVSKEVEKIDNLKSPKFEGIFASRNAGKIAFVLKTPAETFTDKKLDAQNLFVSHLRYLTDLCSSIVVCVPKGYTAPEDLTTPFENQMGIDAQFKETVKAANKNPSLDPLEMEIDKSICAPRNMSYSNDLSNKAFTWTASRKITKSICVYLIEISQLREKVGPYSSPTEFMDIDQIKNYTLNYWPNQNECFYDPNDTNRFYDTFANLFLTLVKKDKAEQLKSLINQFQISVNKMYQEIIKSDLQNGSKITNQLYQNTIEKLNQYSQNVNENRNDLDSTNDQTEATSDDRLVIDSISIFKMFKTHFKEYSNDLKTVEFSRKWNLPADKRTAWSQWEKFVTEKAKVLIQKQVEIFILNTKQFNTVCLIDFWKEATPFLFDYENHHVSEVKIQIYKIAPIQTNSEKVDFVTYQETPYEIVVELKSTVEDEYAVDDLLFVDEKRALVILKSKTQTNIVVFGRLKNTGLNKFSETTTLKSKEAKFVLCGSSNRWVIYDNESQMLNVGEIDDCDKLDGRTVPVYGSVIDGIKVDKIVSLTIVPKLDSLYFINQTNDLFEYNVQSNALRLVCRNENKAGQVSVFTKVSPADINDRYQRVQASPDGKSLFLQSSKAIDVIDLNYYQRTKIEFTNAPLNYKLFEDTFDSFLHLCYKDKTECYILTGFSDKHSLDVQYLIQGKNEIKGCKLFDYISILQQKFGPQSDFIDCPEQNKFILFNPANKKDNKIFTKYFNALKLQNMKICERSSLKDVVEKINKKPLIYQLKTLHCLLISRVPMHLASIDNFTLTPLRNGQSISSEVNSYFKGQMDQNLLIQICKIIGFGVYESFLNSYDKEVYVVSICGHQSSGKSYLLNRIFGTRFDVSVARCTDGIWMSIAKIKTNDDERLFIVLDCEGLFSSRRTETDEIKMCLALTAVSNVTILNQDLSFNRHLSKLFQNFSRLVGRLKSNAFFKGSFLMVIRNVGANDTDGVLEELNRHLRYLLQNGTNQFLKLLFDGEIGSKSFNHYENEVFGNEVAQIRSERFGQNLTTHWTSGKHFVDALKMALVQIFLDDNNNLDVDKVKQNLQEASVTAVQQFYTMDRIVPEKYTFEFQFQDQIYQIEVNHSQVPIDEASERKGDPMIPIRALRMLCEQQVSYSEKYHNDWMNTFKKMSADYFARRNQLVMDFFIGFAPKESEFKELVEVAKEKLAMKIETIINNLFFCEKKCRECNRVCVLKINDRRDCDCRTNHFCSEVCEFSEECKKRSFLCSKRFGHSDGHICGQYPHNCSKTCDSKDCFNKCIKSLNHPENERHDCQSRHPCQVMCSAPNCSRTCQYDRNVGHEHDCGQRRCSHACQLCGDQCMFPDHFHAKMIENNLSHKLRLKIDQKEVLINYHICDKKYHECKDFCPQFGVCQVGYDIVRTTWENSFGKFDYDKFITKEVRLKCAVQIPKGMLYHPQLHNCKGSTGSAHKCNQQCPECLCFCEKDYNHIGKHGSKTHRNKDKNVFVVTKPGETVVLGREGDERRYNVGESCGPENCTSSCWKRGRGHFHIKRCPGGNSCMATINNTVSHSIDTYYPFVGEVFDKWLCKNFWESNNWEPPLNPEQLAEVGKCSYICAVETHGMEKSYCSLDAGHNGRHKFDCIHPIFYFSKVDITFVCDATYSMGPYLVSTNDTIRLLVQQFKESLGEARDIAIAFVAYRDHPEKENDYVTSYINLTTPEKATAFIDKTTANYGGDIPEAVLDGLNVAATKISWRNDSVRYVFHIADAPPHGRLYYNGEDDYPNGCPCGLNIEGIASKFDQLNVRYRLLKIGSLSNTMSEEFSRKIRNFKVFDLDRCEKISEIVIDIMGKDIASSNSDYFRAS